MNEWIQRFERMSEEERAAEARRAYRRTLAALLDPERLKDCSASQLQGILKALEEAYPALRDEEGGGPLGAGPGGGAAPGVCGAGSGAAGGPQSAAAVADWPGADGVHPFVADGLLIADGFAPLRRDILARGHTEYVLPGGRGSTKSSFVSLMLVELLMRYPGLHALAVRQVAATLRDSVYAQLRWAVEALGLEHAWRFVPGRLFMERRATGQRVYFRGADDPTKIKSLKPPFGAVGALWFEELDQFVGEAAVRSIEQSALRGHFSAVEPLADAERVRGAGGHFSAEDGLRSKQPSPRTATCEGTLEPVAKEPLADAQRMRCAGGHFRAGDGAGGATGAGGWIFKSFNPPRAKHHWVNRYAAWEREGMRVHHSDYRGAGVPGEWLGAAFLQRAAALEARDFAAFEHEYLGVANLSGGMVFQNVVARQVSDEEIAGFERVYNGADWGWYPDPWAFNRVAWQAGQRRLVVFGELCGRRKSNAETAAMVLDAVGPDEPVVCDSSEPKSIGDWRAAGVMAQGAEKGPASRAYSMKWLQSLAEIVIDPVRCPNTLREFTECRYRMLPEGGASGEIDARDDHHIDAVRYATERVWRRRGV